MDFWNPSFWLPKNTTWNDFDDTPDVTYPKYYEVCYPIVFSVFMLLLRYLFERFIFISIGKSKGLRANKKPVVSMPLIEEFLKNSPKGICLPNQKQRLLGLAKQLDWSERQVERWIRRRNKQNRHSKLNKFAECGWKVCYHSFTTSCGVLYLWNKSWFWNISECWTNYPHQNLSLEVKLLYLIQLSHYWSLMMSQFFDPRRKDFWGLFVHHLATISLLNISYINNCVRIGVMIQPIHDSADIFLEATKSFKYIKWEWSRDLCFALFVLVWIVTRLVIFPGYILKHLIFDMNDFVQVSPSMKLCTLFLVILFLLHMMWTYFIAKVIYRIFFCGKVGDARSSSSENSGASEN